MFKNMNFKTILILVIVAVAIIFIFFDRKILDFKSNEIHNKSNKTYKTKEQIYSVDSKIEERENNKISKGQLIVHEYLEDRFKDKKFIECRPYFMKNPKTGHNLELDCFNDELNLAVEYNGEQHYNFCEKFHKTREDFEYQVMKDMIKAKLAEKNGINLIVVPYTIKHENIPKYLEEKLTFLGY